MQTVLKNKGLLIAVFGCYAILTAWSMLHHMPWGDELVGWNIAKSSAGFSDLLAHCRYEGHPPGWFTLLWIISKFTHLVGWVQVIQWAIACTTIFLIVFYSPFPLAIKILIPWGYYFLFEYAVFSRNYGIGVLLVCGICMIIRSRFRFQHAWYLALLFLLFNIHLITILLACSLHLYYLLLQRERQQKKGYLLFDVLIGGVFLALALWSIYPPADSSVHVDFQNGNHAFAFKPLVYAPLRCFLPIPAWWRYSFWNTQCLLDAQGVPGSLKFLVALVLIAAVFRLLSPNRKCLALFATNLLLSAIVSITSFSLGAPRYAGFLFIGSFAALWLYCYETPLTIRKQRLTVALLSLQALAGLFTIWKTIRFPFSNLDQIPALAMEVPANRPLVTDYWTMNAYVAFMDRPIYCVDLQKEKTFTMWNSEMVALLKNPYRYTSGLTNLFPRGGTSEVYMVSQNRPELLSAVDAKVMSVYQFELIDKREGAIEKGSNLYLYKITKKYGVLNHP